MDSSETKEKKSLIIVESPTKAKTISKFLGKNYILKSCNGHVRDLNEKNLSIDIKNDFEPIYEIIKSKKKIINHLKKQIEKVDKVYLATDEDREGESISWHLSLLLNLPQNQQNRITFHEITKEALINALKNPRTIDINLVNAQQARRVLDRLVGYEISPLLWKKINSGLSAGRVQTVALRLIVEKEKEINSFVPEIYYTITGEFIYEKDGYIQKLKGTLNHKFKTKEEALSFLELCKNASFTIEDIQKTEIKQAPPPPFITSTLQQEAARKFNLSATQTMAIAQKLYETGQITYMRTDSVTLSNLALNEAKKLILNTFGENYYKFRQYQTKVKGAQEAHEAIRPTYLSKKEINKSKLENLLYSLIWKRTIASQMQDAIYEKITITINVENSNHKFIVTEKKLIFDGFLKVYDIKSNSTTNNENKIVNNLIVGNKIYFEKIYATEHKTKPPERYSEASLIKKLEDLGIGRPSTYAVIISTIKKRGYVQVKDIPPSKTKIKVIELNKNHSLNEYEKNEKISGEKKKLFPTRIGIIVNDYLVERFPDIFEYSFTAEIEKKLDEIAEGSLAWKDLIREFYNKLQEKIKSVQNENEFEINKENFIQNDNSNNVNTYKGKKIGTYKNKDIYLNIGKYGPYLSYNGNFFSLKSAKNINELTLKDAIKIIKLNPKPKIKILKKFNEDKNLYIVSGKYGIYLKYNNKNFPIPKHINWKKLTYDEIMSLIKNKNSK